MGFLRKLFGQPESKPAQTPKPPAPPKIAITLLFPQLPRLEVGQPLLWSEGVSVPLRLEEVVAGEQMMAQAALGKHKMRLVGFSQPLPQAVQQATVHFSNWPEQAKQSMYGHQAHLICFYEAGSPDPVEQLFALYKLAAAFAPQGLLGVADEAAMTANPAGVVADTFTEMPLEALAQQRDIPYLLWVGVLKLFRPDGTVWWVSRGHERFGVPDLAHLAPLGEGEQVTATFSSLLNYMHFYQARLEAGHTAQLGPMQLRFKAPYEYADYIQTPSNPALVVETA